MRAVVAITWTNKAKTAHQPLLIIDLAIAITIAIERVTSDHVTTSSVVAAQATSITTVVTHARC